VATRLLPFICGAGCFYRGLQTAGVVRTKDRTIPRSVASPSPLDGPPPITPQLAARHRADGALSGPSWPVGLVSYCSRLWPTPLYGQASYASSWFRLLWEPSPAWRDGDQETVRSFRSAIRSCLSPIPLAVGAAPRQFAPEGGAPWLDASFCPSICG